MSQGGRGRGWVLYCNNTLTGGLVKLLANLASWFTFYCITRTLSNSIEACLTPVILCYWIWACESWDLQRKRRSVRTCFGCTSGHSRCRKRVLFNFLQVHSAISAADGFVCAGASHWGHHVAPYCPGPVLHRQEAHLPHPDRNSRSRVRTRQCALTQVLSPLFIFP